MSVLVHSWTLKYQKFEEWLQSDIESTESALKDKQITNIDVRQNRVVVVGCFLHFGCQIFLKRNKKKDYFPKHVIFKITTRLVNVEAY